MGHELAHFSSRHGAPKGSPPFHSYKIAWDAIPLPFVKLLVVLCPESLYAPFNIDLSLIASSLSRISIQRTPSSQRQASITRSL
jgi:hypothetical protein